MESFILAGVSLIILVPILYFLPIGFTQKGKVFVVLASLLIGMFGLVSVAVFPLWQTALILLLLVSSLAYLMSKRNLEWMYMQEEDVDPFSIEEEEGDVQKPDIKPSYTYIATSEKNPKGKLEEEISQAQTHAKQLGLLEKLVSRNEKSLSMSSKELEDEGLGEHELEELDLHVKPSHEDHTYNTNPVELENQPDSPVQNDALPQTVNLVEVDNNLELLLDNEEEKVTDPDIEAIIHKTEEEVNDQEANNEDPTPYLNDIEQILETGEMDSNNDTSMKDVPLATINVEDILNPDEELEPKNDIKLKDDPPSSWLNDEFELNEIQLEEIQPSEINGKEKEKHKQTVDENNMVKH